MGLFDELMAKLPDPVPEIRPDTPLYEAVGRFVTSYAHAEAAIHMLARHLSGLSDQKARIVFGGMRLPDLSDIVRRFIKIDKLPQATQDTVDSCLTQLILIGKRRHSLVHRSTHVFDNRMTVTNVLTTKSLKAIETEFFEVQELSDMQSDCGLIYLRLDEIYSPPLITGEDKYWRPWLYKHVPPKTPNLKPRATPAEEQEPPPPSSPERSGKTEG
jgi:hypothetical protein